MNFLLGTPDAAALTMRIVRGWASDMAVAPKEGQDADVVLPIDLETPMAEVFDQRAWKRRGVPALSLLRFARHNGNPATRGSGSDATMDGLLTARREADGRAQGPCKLCLCSGWSFALSKTDELAPRQTTRIGLQDDMIFIGSAAARNPLRTRWLVQVTGSVATHAEYGRQDLNSLRTQSCRWRFGICV